MALALEARAMKDDILIGDTPKAKKRRRRLDGVSAVGRIWKHSTLADIDGLVPISQISTSFCFTLVRNPWGRLVSYYHWLQHQGFDHPAVHLAKQTDFSQFLNTPATQSSLRTNPYGRYMIASDGREYAQLFIRLEHFEDDAAPLWDHLGFRLELPKSNASDHDADHRRYYSDADATLLADLCAQDIERFAYRF